MSAFNVSLPILVYLANGVQGGAVVRAALQRGYRVRALVREPSRCAALVGLGVEVVQGDLLDSVSLLAATQGVAHAVIQFPTGPMVAVRTQAENAFAAARAGGLQSFVLRLASASRHAPCEEPSLVANAMVEVLARQAGLPFAIVRPTMYLDNLLKPSARADIVRRGVFEPPIAADQRIAWTSCDDCAEAALTLLARGAYGGDHRMAGAESLLGMELVERIREGLGGHAVTFRSQPIDVFVREVDAAMGEGMGVRVASKFRYFAAHPAEADAILAAPFTAQAGLEDFRPTGVSEWVARHRSALLAGIAD